MKKYSLLLVLCVGLLCGCKSFIRVTRTVTKTINLPFNINQTGSILSSSIIDGQTFASYFADNNSSFYGSKIEKVDVQGLSIGANLDAGNTAQQVQIGAMIQTTYGTKVLLNDSKVIQLISNPVYDVLSGLGNVTGIDKKNTTLHNAIDLINTTGAVDLQKALKENLSTLNGAITINLTGKVPANQRLVMNLTIQFTATVTYSTCEDTRIPFMGVDDPCIF